VIRLWLEQRRNLEKAESGSSAPLPGDIFGDAYRLMGYALLIAGLLSGAGLAFSFLTYRGTEPLNVSLFIALFVLSQFAILLALAGFRLIRKMQRSPFGPSVVFKLISGLMATLLRRMKQGAIDSLGGSRRGGIESVAGLIRGKRHVYGSLFYWPVFIRAQLFGVGCNVGVLSATLLTVLGSDIAFGWQSTVQFSAEAVYRAVQVLALPWSWFVPTDVAYPSLSEIKGSHMVLKEGIYHLATQDLVSWWPFLCFAVLTYGLAPRVMLLLMGIIFEARAISKVGLDHAACVRLLHRMTTPLIRTGGHLVKTESEPAAMAPAGRAPLLQGEDAGNQTPLTVLIPGDIFDDCRHSDLKTIVSRRLGASIHETFRFGEDPDDDEDVIRQLSRKQKSEERHAFLIVQEAWQPPIRENLRFIQGLREAVGDHVMIWAGLIGRPRQDAIFTPVKEEDWKTWQQKLGTLGDPYLGLERLAADEE